MLTLDNLSPAKGARHRKKRLGAGESSGLGKTSGKGHKGQRARAGGSVRPTFEGGQLPMVRKLPKRGFTNGRFTRKIVNVNAGKLELFFDDGATVNEASLRECGLVKGAYDGIKLLGEGDLAKTLTVETHKLVRKAGKDAKGTERPEVRHQILWMSAGAREKIEKAGGSVVELS